MTTRHLCPAAYVFHIFQGVNPTARAVGRHRSSVYAWLAPKERRGLGGEVPRGIQRTILLRAKERGLDITANDLIFGRTIEISEPAPSENAE